MTINLNAGKPSGLPIGSVNATYGFLNEITVLLNPNSTGTFAYGSPVKIVSQNGGNPMVDVITADTDEIFGFIVYSSYKKEADLKGKNQNIISSGSQAKIKMKATGAIAAGSAVIWDIANVGVTADATEAKRIGYALETASASGDVIDVAVTVPAITNPNF